MTDVVFMDTGILIDAHATDAASKRSRVEPTPRDLRESETGRQFLQVLREFCVSVTRKLANPVARSAAREVVDTYGTWVYEPTTPDTVTRAIGIADLAQISFWDGLIVASAEQATATAIYNEDLNTGRAIAGIDIVNPRQRTPRLLPAIVRPTLPRSGPSASAPQFGQWRGDRCCTAARCAQLIE